MQITKGMGGSLDREVLKAIVAHDFSKDEGYAGKPAGEKFDVVVQRHLPAMGGTVATFNMKERIQI